MQVGTNWGGSYSRFSFDETQRYFYMLKEQGKSVLDDEFNLHQEIVLTLLRRWIIDRIGDGSPNNGFQIVGTSAANDFTIKGGGGTVDNAGHLYVNGYLVILPSDTTYLTQPIAQAALTTPGAPRNDEVYIDVWLDEIDGTEDANIIDPVLGVETSRRLKLQWEIKVVEGGVTPVPFNDGNNIFHNTFHVATLARTAQAAIDAGMVTDVRPLLKWPQDNIDYVLSQKTITKNKADNTQLYAAIQQMIMDATSNGYVIISGATFAGGVVDGEAVRWDGNNFIKALADGSASNRAVGIADVTNTQVYAFGLTGAVLAGLTPGAKQYLDGTTAGALTESVPSDIVKMGVAQSATTMFVDVDHQYVGATEISLGVIELATQAEVDAGTDAVRAVTPATLASHGVHFTNLQVFDASGTFTPPSGVTRVMAEVWGAGGGGSSGNGGAGGGGGYASGIYAVTPGVGIAVTVGNGGGGAIFPTAGGNGEASSLGSLISSNGGVGGAAGGGVGGTGVGQVKIQGGTGQDLVGVTPEDAIGGSSPRGGSGGVRSDVNGVNPGGGAGASDTQGGAGGNGRVVVWW